MFIYFLCLQEPLRLQPIVAPRPIRRTYRGGHSLHHCQPRLATTYQVNMYIFTYICMYFITIFCLLRLHGALLLQPYGEPAWPDITTTHCLLPTPLPAQPGHNIFFQIYVYIFIAPRPIRRSYRGGGHCLHHRQPRLGATYQLYKYIFSHICMNFITVFCLLRLHGTLLLQP